MTIEPPPTGSDPSARVLLRQLAEDATAYARAEAEYLKAELGERTAHLAPTLALYAMAGILGLGLVLGLIVAATLWAASFIGFGWAMAALLGVLGLAIWLLVRAAGRHLQAMLRPWTRP